MTTCLPSAGAAAAWSYTGAAVAAAQGRPKVAAVFTEFRLRSHAFHILTSLMGPYLFRGKWIDPGVDEGVVEVLLQLNPSALRIFGHGAYLTRKPASLDVTDKTFPHARTRNQRLRNLRYDCAVPELLSLSCARRNARTRLQSAPLFAHDLV